MVSDKQRARVAEAAARRQVAPGGHLIPRFDPLRMAAALEVESQRALAIAEIEGTPGKVDIYLDPRDALALAEFLRRRGG